MTQSLVRLHVGELNSVELMEAVRAVYIRVAEVSPSRSAVRMSLWSLVLCTVLQLDSSGPLRGIGTYASDDTILRTSSS
jgi:hypothetical protein